MALSLSSGGMVVNITIRDVPPHVRDEIARRAKLRGQSTQEFLWSVLERLATKPDKAEVLARVEKRATKLGSIDVMAYLERSNDGRY